MTIEQMEKRLVDGSGWTKEQRINALRLAYLGCKELDDATKDQIAAYHKRLEQQLEQATDIKTRDASRRWNARHL